MRVDNVQKECSKRSLKSIIISNYKQCRKYKQKLVNILDTKESSVGLFKS